MGYVFWIIGVVILLNAFTMTAENSIHQIYVQLQFLTAAVCIGCGQIVITTSAMFEKAFLGKMLKSIREELEEINTKLTDNKEDIKNSENIAHNEEEN